MIFLNILVSAIILFCFIVPVCADIPIIDTISPSSGQPEQTYDVAITGSGFEAGESIVTVEEGDITVDTFSVTENLIDCQFTIDSEAETGERTVTVTNPTSGEFATGTFTIISGPLITSIDPSSGQPGETYDVTITGTGFEAGESIVAVEEGDITVDTFSVTENLIDCQFTIPSDAETGERTVTVTNPTSGASVSDTFTVSSGPSITSISPSTGQQGGTYDVTFTGTGFEAGESTVEVEEGDITVETPSIREDTRIVCQFTIPSDADIGERTVTVTNPTSGEFATGTFTINPGPSITSISPASGQQGGTYDVTITGKGFEVRKSTVSFGNGISVKSYSIRTATKIACKVAISAKATKGQRTITVMNPTSGAFATGKITILSGPVITKIFPDKGQKGGTYILTITGKNFENKKSTILVSGSGVSVKSYTTRTTSKIVCKVAITTTAKIGKRTLTVTNPTGGAIVAGKFTVTAKSGTEIKSGQTSGVVLSSPVSMPSSAVLSPAISQSGGRLVPINTPVVSPGILAF